MTQSPSSNSSQWNPEAIWKVTVWNRFRFLEVEVMAGNEAFAKTVALGSLVHDGEQGHHLSVTEVTRIG